MTEGSSELSIGINPSKIADNLTYVSCSGKLMPESAAVCRFWQSVSTEYAKQIASKRNPDFIELRNRYGATHTISNEESNVYSNRNVAQLYFQAVESLIFAERYSDSGIEILNLNNSKEIIPYAILDRDPNSKKKINGRKYNAVIGFRDNSGKPTGTSLVLNDGEIKVYQRLMIEGGKEIDILVLQIKGDSSNKRTEMTAYIDTESGSRKTFSEDSSKIFWILRDGLLWSDVYPHPGSVAEFKDKINRDDVTEGNQT